MSAPPATGLPVSEESDLDLARLVTGFRTLRAHHRRGTEPEGGRDAAIAHLRLALEGAVTLEFATIPPYLCALWSVKDDLSYVARSLRQVLQEEMLHMALAANMLVSIGGRPPIARAVPVYPGKLPLDVHPELTVPLAGLSDGALTTFMEIERPNHPGHHISLNAAAELDRAHDRAEAEAGPEAGPGSDPPDYTIGELYDHIEAAFLELAPEQSTHRQVTAPLASMVVANPQDAARAIAIIKREGEGSEGPADTGPYNLAHYYRFAEILERRQLVRDPETGDYAFTTPIDFDPARDVWPMAAVPEGGYRPEAVPDADVRHLLAQFNTTFTRLVDLLQSVWESDAGQGALWHAVDVMFELERHARPLMQMPRPDGRGNYGPEFRYLGQGRGDRA